MVQCSIIWRVVLIQITECDHVFMSLSQLTGYSKGSSTRLLILVTQASFKQNVVEATVMAMVGSTLWVTCAITMLH